MKRVAVLGAGIMGSATALFLSRRHVQVTLFDAADEPFAGASRWNEGKIHLGYLYAADASLGTARRLLPGGLAFKDLTEELIGCSLDEAIARHDDTYLVHRDSVVGVEATERYFAAVAGLVTSHPDANRYLAPVGAAQPRRLTAAQLAAHYDTDQIVAGFQVPERSLSTRWVADRFVGALAADAGIEQRMQTVVRGVRHSTSAIDSPLWVDTSLGVEGPFDVVVNALWEGRLAVDATLGLPPPTTWSHRYRLAAFVRTAREVAVPSAVIGTGPFGDVKNYNGRDLYLSWYLTGLVADGSDVAPPCVPRLDPDERARMIDAIVEQLGQVVPAVGDLRSCLDQVRLEGGWVYAAGQGSLADAASTLHRRDRIGITRTGSYLSVDTGKYSIAPWLAREIAAQIA